MTISSARVAGDSARTRFILDMEEEVRYALTFLADPYRVVIDLEQVLFDFSKTPDERARGLVNGWRYGAVAKGRSRVVLDLAAPVMLDKTFMIPKVQDQPARLVIDLVGANRDAFLRQADELNGKSADYIRDFGAHNSHPQVAVGKSQNAQNAGKLGNASAVALAIDAGGMAAQPAKRAGRKLIVLDAGHGGIDSGAVGEKGTLEKAVVLQFTLMLADKLKALGPYDIRLTRDNDRFIPLRKRREFAHELQADLFISLHADSITEGAEHTRGASVYTLSENASDRLAATLARQENKADLIGGIDLSEEPEDVGNILLELARRETENFSVHFARLAVEELKSATRVINKPLRSAGFAVLKSPDVPSVLVELGFLSNSHDEAMLTSDDWRERASDALVEAINAFFRGRIAQQGSSD